jgi:hypothetical protein
VLRDRAISCAFFSIVTPSDAPSLPLLLEVAVRFGLGLLEVIESSLVGNRAAPVAAVDDDLEDCTRQRVILRFCPSRDM